MKKILSGLIYRALRSIETWVLIGFFIFASIFISCISISDPDNGISADPGKRFESLDVSPKDAYRLLAEALPEDVYYKLDTEDEEVTNEIRMLYDIPDTILMIQIISLVIYLPVFLGRMFSDGTVKNLIAGGHSKGKIYLSSLLFSIVLDIAMMITGTCLFMLMCLILGWHPPIYFPIAMIMFLISMLISVMVSSVCVAVLFISRKPTVAFVVSFLLMFMLYFVSVSVPAAIIAGTQRIDTNGENVKRIKQIRDEAPYDLEEYFVLSEFNYRFTYHGEDIVFFGDSYLPSPVKTAVLLVTYADPALVLHTYEGISISYYIMYRDGLMAINIASNIFWITLSSFCGIIVFRRKEIHC